MRGELVKGRGGVRANWILICRTIFVGFVAPLHISSKGVRVNKNLKKKSFHLISTSGEQFKWYKKTNIYNFNIIQTNQKLKLFKHTYDFEVTFAGNLHRFIPRKWNIKPTILRHSHLCDPSKDFEVLGRSFCRLHANLDSYTDDDVLRIQVGYFDFKSRGLKHFYSICWITYITWKNYFYPSLGTNSLENMISFRNHFLQIS